MPNSLIKLLLDPSILILAILILIWLLAFTPWRAAIRRLVFFCILILGLLHFGPLPALLSQPLATRYPPADLGALPNPELIIVLGGMTANTPVQEPGTLHPPFVRRSERFLMGLQLALRHPEATLVFSGWGGAAAGVEGAEATRLAALAIALGIPPDQILIEPLAQTTADHPVQLSNLRAIGPNPLQETYLVTSAIHMPRAMGVFETAGWPKIHAIPVDFPYPLDTPWYSLRAPAGRRMTITYEALVEWAGLIAYRNQGHISNLLSNP